MIRRARAHHLVSLGLAMAAGCATADTGPVSVTPSAPAASLSVPLPVDSPPVVDDLAAHVPAGAESVLTVNLRALRASPWAASLLRGLSAADREQRRSLRGFDEVEDADRMLLVGLGGGDSLLIMEGRFDEDHIFAAAHRRWPTAPTTYFRGRRIVGDGGEAVALLSERLFATGPLAAVRGALDCQEGRVSPLASSPWLISLRKNLTARVAGHPNREPDLALAVDISDEMRPGLESELEEGRWLRRFGARVDLSEALDLVVVGQTAAAADAADLATRMAARIQGLQDQRSLVALGLDGMLKTATFTGTGSWVVGHMGVAAKDRGRVAERLAVLAQVLSARQKAKTTATKASTD